MATAHDFADQPFPCSLLRQHGVVLQRLEDTLSTNVPPLVTHHSPTGYAWGSAGSGPADLVRTVLAELPCEEGHQGPTVACWQGRGFRRAWDLHQPCKAAVLAACRRDVVQIPLTAVRDWLARVATTRGATHPSPGPRAMRRPPQPMVYVIGECKVLERARMTPEGLAGTTRLTWVEQPAYGVHRRTIDAKRAWVLANNPDIEADASDDVIRRHFDAQRRNLGPARVLKRPAALPDPPAPAVPWRPPQQ